MSNVRAVARQEERLHLHSTRSRASASTTTSTSSTRCSASAFWPFRPGARSALCSYLNGHNWLASKLRSGVPLCKHRAAKVLVVDAAEDELRDVVSLLRRLGSVLVGLLGIGATPRPRDTRATARRLQAHRRSPSFVVKRCVTICQRCDVPRRASLTSSRAAEDWPARPAGADDHVSHAVCERREYHE